MRIGLISDTHLPSLMRHLDELGPQVGEFLSDVDLILHGGDVVGRAVIDWCEQYAPTLVSRGNNDIFDDPRTADVQRLTVDGWRIAMTHELRPEGRPMAQLLDATLPDEEVDILIGGDTHLERLEYRAGVVLINSGSPTLPHHKDTRLGTVALLEIAPDRLHAEIVSLGHTEGHANPGTPQHIEIEARRIVAASYDGAPASPDEISALIARSQDPSA